MKNSDIPNDESVNIHAYLPAWESLHSLPFHYFCYKSTLSQVASTCIFGPGGCNTLHSQHAFRVEHSNFLQQTQCPHTCTFLAFLPEYTFAAIVQPLFQEIHPLYSGNFAHKIALCFAMERPLLCFAQTVWSEA
jgi:hypothetical protein